MQIFLRAKTLHYFFLTLIELSAKSIYYLLFSLNLLVAKEKWKYPVPIPNLVVKHFIADNTAGSPGGNVGRCQLLSIYSSLYLFTYLKVFR